MKQKTIKNPYLVGRILDCCIYLWSSIPYSCFEDSENPFDKSTSDLHHYFFWRDISNISKLNECYMQINCFIILLYIIGVLTLQLANITEFQISSILD